MDNEPKDLSEEQNTTTDSKELEKSQVHIIVEIVEYVPDAVVCKSKNQQATSRQPPLAKERNWQKERCLMICSFR